MVGDRMHALSRAIVAFERSRRSYDDYCDLIAAAQTLRFERWTRVQEAVRAGLDAACPAAETADAILETAAK